MAKFRLGNGKEVVGKEEQVFIDCLSESFDEKARTYLRGTGASFCPRQNYFNSKEWDFKSKNSASAQAYMAFGNGLEEGICKGLIRKNRLLVNNQWLPEFEAVKVSGKIDLIYLDSSNKLALGEIKTCGELPNKGKPEHVSQAESYAAIAGFDRMNLIYFSRNVMDRTGNLLIKVFQIDTSKENMIRALSSMIYSKMAIEENFKPYIPLGFHKTTTCLYCKFNDFCWGKAKEDYKSLDADKDSEKWVQAEEIGKILYAERNQRRLQMFLNMKKEAGKVFGDKVKIFRMDIVNDEIQRLQESNGEL